MDVLSLTTLCRQIQKDLIGCDIDRVTLSDHTQDYKIVLARKEVMKKLSLLFFSFIATNHFRLFISIHHMNEHSALLLKVCVSYWGGSITECVFVYHLYHTGVGSITGCVFVYHLYHTGVGSITGCVFQGRRYSLDGTEGI